MIFANIIKRLFGYSNIESPVLSLGCSQMDRKLGYHSLIGSNSHNDKAKPVVKQGRKATDLIKDSRVAKQDGHPGFFSGFVTTSRAIFSENNIIKVNLIF